MDEGGTPLPVGARDEREWRWTPVAAEEFQSSIHPSPGHETSPKRAMGPEPSVTPRDFLLRWRGVRVNVEPGLMCWGFRLPTALTEIADAIKASRSMLALPDNWDGEGSPGYDDATWCRAIAVVVQASTAAWRQQDQRPPVPQISKGPEGSIDILWQVGTSKALINVPADPAQPTTFFAYDPERGRQLGEGTIDLEGRNEWLLSWLTA